MSQSRGGQTRLGVVIGSGAIVAIAIVAIAFGVNSASAPLPAVPTATPAPTPTPSPTPVSTIAFADCAAATFGAVLKPINPPASVHTYAAAPAVTIDATKLYQATIATPKGSIVLCLQPDLAPNTVNVFVTLARNHFYDGIPFHRVVAGFVIQAGDPQCIGHVPVAPATPSGTCGNGGPGFKFNDEPVRNAYVAGCVAMANSGANTNGSQFFICTANDSTLPKSYNLFGKVESGMPVALKIVQGTLITSITVREQI